MKTQRDDGCAEPVDHRRLAGELAEPIAWEDPLVVVHHVEGEGDGFGLIEVLAQIGGAQDSGSEDDGEGCQPDGEGGFGVSRWRRVGHWLVKDITNECPMLTFSRVDS